MLLLTVALGVCPPMDRETSWAKGVFGGGRHREDPRQNSESEYRNPSQVRKPKASNPTPAFGRYG